MVAVKEHPRLAADATTLKLTVVGIERNVDSGRRQTGTAIMNFAQWWFPKGVQRKCNLSVKPEGIA
jgi:hypothetical protein